MSKGALFGTSKELAGQRARMAHDLALRSSVESTRSDVSGIGFGNMGS